jgi:hypothetical protein
MSRESLLIVAALVLCTSCGGDSSTGGEVIRLGGQDMTTVATDMGLSDAQVEVDAAPDRQPDGGNASVEMTVRVVNPATGQGYSGVTASGPRGDQLTDGAGRAVIAVPTGAYQVRLEANGARAHTVWGVAGENAFEQITYMSPEMITGFVFSSLGLSDDSTKGILVVGLDTPTLAPAIGAEATIDTEHGTPFVFAGRNPTMGRRIPMGGQGFVTFPNVNPGEVAITTSFPEGACRVFPAETDDNMVEVVAGEVTVIAFTCREDG